MAWMDKIKGAFGTSGDVELTEDYVELETNAIKETTAKVLVRAFSLNNFEDVKPILDAIRDGSTIALINIGPLKEKDMDELKRAIDKIKKTIDANSGDIAGLADNLIVATPSFARVHREKKVEPEAGLEGI